MVSPNPNEVQFSRNDLLWRLVITLIILAMLTGFSLTVFNTVTTQPDTRVLPTLIQEAPSR